MKEGRIFIGLIVLLLQTMTAWSQDTGMDSLKRELDRAKHDTTRCRILNEMVELEVDDNVWPKYNVSLKLMADYNLRKYHKGHPCYPVFRKYQAASLNNIGYLHALRGDVFHSLEYYYRALNIQHEVKDRKGEATTYNNLGSAFDDQGEHDKAVEYYRKGYAIQQEIGDKVGMAISLLNIGFYYDNKGNEHEALDQYLRSLALSQEIDDPQGQVYTMNNISLTYLGFKQYQKALQYAHWALEISLHTDYTEGIAFSYNCIGNVYEEMNELDKAREYGLKSYAIAQDLGFPSTIGNAAELLSEVYEKQGDHERALKFYKTRVQMRDSVNNEQNKKLSIKKQFQIEYARKMAADSVKTLEEKKLFDATYEAREQKERIQRMALVGGLILVLVFAIFMYNRFRLTRQQSRIIAVKEKEAQHQKNLVVRKQKEIIDSINYAKRIQSAILAREDEIRKYFPESFLLYKPKDIVAGDFYFFETTDTHVFYAAADCTGHGVPGALVSVVCSNALTRCVKEFGLTDPGQILDRTRELVLETFRHSGQEVKDGMDISLISLKFDVRSSMLGVGNEHEQGNTSNSQIYTHTNFKPHPGPVEGSNFELLWSGANNPLWIIDKTGTEVTEIRPDKQPIGFSENAKPFTTHRLELEPGSSVFLFTDGYADQFGGEKGKKFKYKNLAKLLREHFAMPMIQQVEVLDTTFENWRGDLEQIDDVCVIGVKL